MTFDFALMYNLPSKLKKLSIDIRKDSIINISDLPNQLTELFLRGIKFNLDYLPVSLKKFHLVTNSDGKPGFDSIFKYTKADFSNLPSGLEEIIIDYNNKYSSITELLDYKKLKKNYI